MRKSVLKGFASRLFNAVGCIKIGLTDFQMNDAGASALQLLGPFEHIHHDKGAHFFSTFRGHFQTLTYSFAIPKMYL